MLLFQHVCCIHAHSSHLWEPDELRSVSLYLIIGASPCPSRSAVSVFLERKSRPTQPGSLKMTPPIAQSDVNGHHRSSYRAILRTESFFWFLAPLQPITSYSIYHWWRKAWQFFVFSDTYIETRRDLNHFLIEDYPAFHFEINSLNMDILFHVY